MKIHITGRPNPESHSISASNLVNGKATAGEEAGHLGLDLAQACWRYALHHQTVQDSKIETRVKDTSRVFTGWADYWGYLRIFQHVGLSRSQPFGRQIGQPTQSLNQRIFGTAWRQQVPEAPGPNGFLSIDATAHNRHGHLAAFAAELPLIRRVSIQQRDTTLPATVNLVDHVGYRAEPHGCTVQHKPRRPLVFANRLIQQYEPLQHRRLPRGVNAGQQRQWTKWQLQQRKTFEVSKFNPCKHRQRPPVPFELPRTDTSPSWCRLFHT